MTQRTCAATGLVLFDGPVVAHRVARESYGPLRPLMRPDEDARDAWSRFDTPGRTIYAAADSSTAYAEALAWARQDIANERRELSKTAAHFGLSIEDLWADIWDEWHANESMAPGWLPAVWRGGRRLYEVRFGRGPWVDIDHSETLRVISGALREELETRWGVCGGLTLADVKSERRGVTTRIAEWLRETVTLDDGSQPKPKPAAAQAANGATRTPGTDASMRCTAAAVTATSAVTYRPPVASNARPDGDDASMSTVPMREPLGSMRRT